MSEIAESARVTVLICDYATVDSAGKLNILGGGWQATSLQTSGMTAAQTVGVLIDVPPRHYAEEFALSLTLLDASNEPVKVSGPTGELETLRVSQLSKADRPSVHGLYLPAEAIPGRVQAVLNFPTGLPLSSGQTYTWQVEIDGDKNEQWCAKFHVAGSPPGPVRG